MMDIMTHPGTWKKYSLVVYVGGKEGATEINDLLVDGWSIDNMVSDRDKGVFFTLGTADYALWLETMPKYLNDQEKIEKIKKLRFEYAQSPANQTVAILPPRDDQKPDIATTPVTKKVLL